MWLWGASQKQAFSRVKEELLKPTTLALYDPEAETIISADASSYGLGAVLLQKSAPGWKPIAYASRSINVQDRETVRLNRERGASHYVGM